MSTYKRAIFLFFLLVILPTFLTSCNEGGGAFKEVQAGSSKLLGVWQLEATKISPGGAVDWSEVNSKNQYTFKADGSFSYLNADNNAFNTSGSFSIEDDELELKYSRDGKEITGAYYLLFNDGKLILEFKGCIEECKERYRRKD